MTALAGAMIFREHKPGTPHTVIPTPACLPHGVSGLLSLAQPGLTTSPPAPLLNGCPPSVKGIWPSRGWPGSSLRRWADGTVPPHLALVVRAGLVHGLREPSTSSSSSEGWAGTVSSVYPLCHAPAWCKRAPGTSKQCNTTVGRCQLFTLHTLLCGNVDIAETILLAVYILKGFS